ncbi:MAG: DUF3604 domain-containing protein [Pseudomonadota bacterium]|nr:DUF3604 domain-containing protein [Pseudomonadota bacterium]
MKNPSLALLVFITCNILAVEPKQSTSLYWGDTHVHTYLSADAYGLGTRMTPDTAYRYARGETITADNGEEVRIREPLDFLMVADHAENIGVRPALAAGKKLRLTDAGNAMRLAIMQSNPSIRDLVAAPTLEDQNAVLHLIGKAKGDWKSPLSEDKEFTRSVWGDVIAIAEKYNDPGTFTTFIGFEWTGLYMMHRNVMFADGKEKTSAVLPFSLMDSADPEDLWQYLANYEESTGGRVMAIPHNANLSNGAMFSVLNFAGKPLTSGYANTRSRWERIYEVTQYKGDSEAHPDLSLEDEFADFEKMGRTSRIHRPQTGPVKAKTDGKDTDNGKNAEKLNTKMLQSRVTNEQKTRLMGSFARPALKQGLSEQEKLGINPFKLGLIGSTDSHIGLSSGDEAGYIGKQGAFRAASAVWNAAGYAGVWASENTRESLFAAMERREVFASTGPRISVRFFGGWDFQAEDLLKPKLAEVGYRKGVPMGSDLTQAPQSKAPSFLIRAVRDPDGANLDRLQVIKGWLDDKGSLREKIYNVALSDNRRVKVNGGVEPVGNSVDLSNATYTNTIGAPELGTVWRDPDFQVSEPAFYYVRVLQIPTPRWTTFDVVSKNAKFGPEIPLTTQERVYTSPIWYTP